MELKTDRTTLIVLNKHNIELVSEKTGQHPDELLKMLAEAKRYGKSNIILNADGTIW